MKPGALKNLLILCFALLTACCHADTKANPTSGSERAEIFNFTGTVTHLDLEGGFFAIVTDDGTKLDPVNLPPEMRKNGLRVQGTARKAESSIGVHMWGTRIEIESIEAL